MDKHPITWILIAAFTYMAVQEARVMRAYRRRGERAEVVRTGVLTAVYVAFVATSLLFGS